MKKISYFLFLLGLLNAFSSMAIDGFTKTDLGWKADNLILPFAGDPKFYEIKDDRFYLKLQNENLEEIGKFTGETFTVCYEYVVAFLKNKYPLLSNLENLACKGFTFDFIELFIGDFMEEVEEPQKDDIVAYYGWAGSYMNNWKFNHVGIMASPNMVKAKWGMAFDGKVLEHKLKAVPSSHGPYLKFYRLKDEFKDIEAYKTKFFDPLYEQLFFKFSLLNTLKLFYEEYIYNHKKETINRIKDELLNAEKEINNITNNHINKHEKKVELICEQSFVTPVSTVHHRIIHDLINNWLNTKNGSKIHEFLSTFLLKIIKQLFNNEQMSPLTNDYTDSMINEIIDVDSVINKINEEREKEKMEQIEQIKLYKGKIPNDIFNKLKIYKESKY